MTMGQSMHRATSNSFDFLAIGAVREFRG